MRKLFLPGAVVLLVSTASADKNPKPPKPPPPPPKAHTNGGAGAGAAAPKRASDEQIRKLSEMSPAQREKALSNLPPERRARVEAAIEKWNQTPAQLKALNDKFQSLPPEQQKKIRQLSQRIKSLSPDRKAAVTQELNRLRNMPEDQREKRLNSPAIQKNFSPDEQAILRETPGLLPHDYF
jgi:hypothetical protein